MNAAGVFYKIEMPEEKATSVTPISKSGCCPVYTCGVTGVFECISQVNLDLLDDIVASCCGFVVIYQGANGARYMFGNTPDRPAKFSGEGEINFGTALEDDNQSTWTLQAKQLKPMRQLADGVTIPV